MRVGTDQALSHMKTQGRLGSFQLRVVELDLSCICYANNIDYKCQPIAGPMVRHLPCYGVGRGSCQSKWQTKHKKKEKEEDYK